MAFYLPDSQPHNCECDFILIMRRHLSKHSAAQLENIKIKTSPIFTGVRKQTCCPVCVCVGGELSMFGRRNHAGYGSVNTHVLLRLIWLWRKKGLCYISLHGERFCFRSLVRGRHSTSCWMAVLKIADKVCQQTAWPCLMNIVFVFDYV